MSYQILGIAGGFSILLAVYLWYASLIKRRNKALEALSGVDVQLRKRFDLLPNVLKTAARFMAHEKELLNRITELRNQALRDYDERDPNAIKAHLDALGALQPAAMKLFAVSENYPELKSNKTMILAQQTFAEVEGHVSAARRAYNAAVTALNNAAQIFPGNLIAAAVGVGSMPYYEEPDESVRRSIDADAYLA